MGVGKYEVLPDLLYTSEHEWVKIEGKIATCGITDYAQKSLSDIVFVELPQVGKEVKSGEVVCVVESVKAVSDVFSPVSGKIIDVNKKLESEPSLINKSPYKEGWIFKVEIEEKENGFKLLSAEEYQKLLEEIEQGR
jgi:glycine cleavage system H protein